MASSVVVKVKYGDSLRRFHANVNGDKRLDLDMEGLRVKIRSLFNFPSDADFTLTYVDEDDDVVTLADNEDLHDVIRQGLDPVRISVHLSTNKSSRPCSKSSGTSTPSRSSSQNCHQDTNPGVTEALKSVPEPFLDALSKLSHDLASKALSTSPILGDLIDSLSKMGLHHLDASRTQSSTADISSPNEARDNLGNNSATQQKREAPTAEGIKSNGVQISSSGQPSSKTSLVPDAVEAARVADPTRPPLPHPSLLREVKNAYLGNASINRDATKKMKESIGDSGVNVDTDNRPKVGESKRKDKEVFRDSARKSRGHGDDFHRALRGYGISSRKENSEASVGENWRSWFPTANSLNSAYDSNNMGECPFLGTPYNFSNQSYKNFADGTGSLFHKGVRCDGCGVLPITGPRFKSNVKHNYDLCNICFDRMGNYSEYTRIDHSVQYYLPPPLKGFYGPMFDRLSAHLPVQVPPPMGKPRAAKNLRSKLDSRFIVDVNVMDGTMMAPSTPFTKMWRMRNNGALPWARGSQLLWIGGDRFSASDSVEIEMPVDGVSVGNELDIAVDFIAPELPGRYISYWRMADPSGLKFGQRIWVLIQVDASLAESIHESSSSLNLNLPPESSGTQVPPVLDVKVEPSADVEAADLNSTPQAEKPSPSAVSEQKSGIEMKDLNFPINDDLLIPSNVSSSPTSLPSSLPTAPLVTNPDNDADAKPYDTPTDPHASDSFPIIDMSEVAISSDNTKVDDDKRSPEPPVGEHEVEEIMLKELEQMGFKQIDLNKEVLRMNEYDLEKSVDELCGVSEWDPILEELQEMGFHDKETNKKLLAKNNGSIMRVVMDLVSGEKA